MTRVAWEFPARLDQLSAICAESCRFAKESLGMVTESGEEDDNPFVSALELAVGEGCANAIKHRGPGPWASERILVSFSFDGKVLEVEIKDSNPPFDFHQIPEPQFEGLPESGYGLYLIRQLMDRVHYQRRDGWNILRFAKRICQGGSSWSR